MYEADIKTLTQMEKDLEAKLHAIRSAITTLKAADEDEKKVDREHWKVPRELMLEDPFGVLKSKFPNEESYIGWLYWCAANAEG